jgi:hypothetical protein
VRRYLGIADDLFFDLAIPAALAGGAFFFGHYVWGVVFAIILAVEVMLRGRRTLCRRREGDDYFARPS